MTQTAKAPTGVSIWNAMREELTLNLYPLPYTTLPPSVFYVYLHPADFDRIEGIVRESVRPMEKIDGIKILHVDGVMGAANGNRNVTDEVIDSALRYRVQAPMIDRESTPPAKAISIPPMMIAPKR